MKLTDKTLATLPVPTDVERTYYWDEELPGFGVAVSRSGTKTFIVRGRAPGRRDLVKRSIGAAGAVRSDGHAWNVLRARIEARRFKGELAGGKVRPTRSDSNGPTLRAALEIHIANMRITGGKGPKVNGKRPPCSERSIATLQNEVEKYLADWLDAPIVDLTAAALTKVCDELRATTKPRAGSANVAGAALTKRLVSHVSAIWSSADRLHDLPTKNPAERVTTHGIAPKEERIEPTAFASWRARIEKLSPVRRDFNLLALFTAIRSDGLRHMRWEDVDFDERVVHVTRAKGNRPYTIPMTATVERILRARQTENAELMREHGDDHGWVLPTTSRARNADGAYDVIPMAEAKEYDLDDKTGERTKAIPGPHALRKTWNSVALEERIGREDREALMNHEGNGVNVKHYGFPRSWEGLRAAAEAVEAALWRRIEGKAPAARKGKLRAV